MTRVRLVTTNPRGMPCGDSHHWTRFSAATVAEAHRLRDQGVRVTEIAARLGCNRSTLWRWLAGLRKPAARLIARRAKPGTPRSGSSTEPLPVNDLLPSAEKPTSKPTPGSLETDQPSVGRSSAYRSAVVHVGDQKGTNP